MMEVCVVCVTRTGVKGQYSQNLIAPFRDKNSYSRASEKTQGQDTDLIIFKVLEEIKAMVVNEVDKEAINVSVEKKEIPIISHQIISYLILEYYTLVNL